MQRLAQELHSDPPAWADAHRVGRVLRNCGGALTKCSCEDGWTDVQWKVKVIQGRPEVRREVDVLAFVDGAFEACGAGRDAEREQLGGGIVLQGTKGTVVEAEGGW